MICPGEHAAHSSCATVTCAADRNGGFQSGMPPDSHGTMSIPPKVLHAAWRLQPSKPPPNRLCCGPDPTCSCDDDVRFDRRLTCRHRRVDHQPRQVRLHVALGRLHWRRCSANSAMSEPDAGLRGSAQHLPMSSALNCCRKELFMQSQLPSASEATHYGEHVNDV